MYYWYRKPIVVPLFFHFMISHETSSFSSISSPPPKSSSYPPRRLILLDRDGVLNQDVGPPGVLQPSQLRLIPHSALAVGNLKRAGHTVVLVTNQSCVGKGLLTSKGLEEMHHQLRSLLQSEDPDAVLDHVYCCTSIHDNDDMRKKPNPGMVHEACRDYNVNSGRTCVFIGDTMSDMMAAASAGVETRVLVETGYGREVMNGRRAPSNEREVVLETGMTNTVGMVEKIDRSLEEDDSGRINPAVFPFMYAKDLCTAVDWILG